MFLIIFIYQIIWHCIAPRGAKPLHVLGHVNRRIYSLYYLTLVLLNLRFMLSFNLNDMQYFLVRA